MSAANGLCEKSGWLRTGEHSAVHLVCDLYADHDERTAEGSPGSKHRTILRDQMSGTEVVIYWMGLMERLPKEKRPSPVGV